MKNSAKNATIIDIAKKIGISVSTVSRALSDHPDIKNETKELVRKIAEELNYTPNTIAKSLKNNRSIIIGVIVPEIKHDFFSSAISGIEDVAYEAGYTIILCQSNESYKREVINTQELIHHRVAGVIVSIAQNTLVFFDRVCDDVMASKVMIDDYKCAFNAVTYLVSRGYKRIAHFAGPEELLICKKRLSGYYEALKQAKLCSLDGFVLYGGMHEQDGYNSMDAMINENMFPDAVFAVNDPVALGAYQRIKEAKLKIPNDIAIMGFSNNKITSLVDPQITTIDQPSFEMGRKAAEILIQTIEGKLLGHKTLILEATLIARGST
jgi:DNA-binding LacI/PurR family transcriptional regulator